MPNTGTGKALKIVARVWGVVFAIGSFVGGCELLFYDDTALIGIAILLGGLLFALASGLALYGFGIIVERVEMQIEQEKKPYSPMYTAHTVAETKPQTAPQGPAINGQWKCTCGKVNPPYMSSCSCGKTAREIREMNKNQNN